jgi:hypothetical protein
MGSVNQPSSMSYTYVIRDKDARMVDAWKQLKEHPELFVLFYVF